MSNTERDLRPSRLDMLLRAHRKDNNGHILLTPFEASQDLIEILYALYKEQASTTDPRIEALKRIVGNTPEDKLEAYDFTATNEAIIREREQSRLGGSASREYEAIHKPLVPMTPSERII